MTLLTEWSIKPDDENIFGHWPERHPSQAFAEKLSDFRHQYLDFLDIYEEGRLIILVREQGAYLGGLLIVILILQFLDIRRRPYLKPLLVSLLLLLIFSFGPRLHVAVVTTDLWLPWRLALDLPFIRQALPTRFSMYVALAAALAAALWLSVAKRGWDRARRFTLAALACVFLVPNLAIVRHWTPLPLVAFFEPQNVAASLGHDANVIMLPYGETGPGLFWQLASGMAFTQSGGYVGFPPPAELSWRILYNFDAGVGGTSFENDISAFCVTHRVSAILVGPGTPAPLAAAVDALHWQETQDHGVRVVKVPDPRDLHFYYVLGDYWPTGPGETWMGQEIKIATAGQRMQLRITGRYRPAELGPVEIRVVNGPEVSSYRIARENTLLLTLPADACVILTANATFVPARVLSQWQRAASIRAET
jgi:hypothetical protein